MTTVTLTLAEFLLARIAEDEAAANDALADPIANWNEQDWVEIDGSSLAHVYRHNPARVLAECEAKRRIVERHTSTPVLDHHYFECTCGFRDHRLSQCQACGTTTYDEGEWERSYGPCPDLRLLALPYAGHEDYRPEWRP